MRKVPNLTELLNFGGSPVGEFELRRRLSSKTTTSLLPERTVRMSTHSSILTSSVGFHTVLASATFGSLRCSFSSTPHTSFNPQDGRCASAGLTLPTSLSTLHTPEVDFVQLPAPNCPHRPLHASSTSAVTASNTVRFPLHPPVVQVDKVGRTSQVSRFACTVPVLYSALRVVHTQPGLWLKVTKHWEEIFFYVS